MNEINVVVSNHEKNITKEIKEILNAQSNINVVGYAYDGERTMELIKEKRPTVVILDPFLSGVDGIGVMERVKETKDRNVKYLVTTKKGQEKNI